jgi:nitrogen-specific signal transduction histidine kinase
VTTVPGDDADFPAPPFDELHARLLEQVGSLEAAGAADAADALRAAVHAWWEAQQAWNLRLADTLSVHHEINNALVGVRGNAQLMMMGPAGQEPGLKERLEVVLRESSRIQIAAARLRPVRARLAGHGPARHAA